MIPMYAKVEEPFKVGNYRVVVYRQKNNVMVTYDVCEGSIRDIDNWLYKNYPGIDLKNSSMVSISTLHDLIRG